MVQNSSSMTWRRVGMTWAYEIFYRYVEKQTNVQALKLLKIIVSLYIKKRPYFCGYHDAR